MMLHRRLCLLAVILLPLLAYYSILGFYVLDIPKADDYGDSLQTLVEIRQAESLAAKSKLFFKQHVDHRTSVNRSLYLLSLALLNRVDFSLLILIGNSALLFIVFIFYLSFRKSDSRLVSMACMIPVTYFIFQPSAYVSMFWAMASLSNYLVMLWALLCLYFLAQLKTVPLILSALFACLACFTQANGIACLPLGLAYLLWMTKRGGSPQAGVYCFVWCVLSALILLAFNWGYQFSLFTEAADEAHQLAAHFKVQYSLTSSLHWIVALLGSSVAQGNLGIAVATGFTLIFVLGYFAVTGIYRFYPVLTLYTIFVLVSIGMIAFMRAEFLPIQFSQSSRYTFYSAQLLAVVAAVTFHQLMRQSGNAINRLKMAALALAAILFCGGQYVENLDKIKMQQRGVLMGLWLWNSEARQNPFAPLVSDAGKILSAAIKAGIYHPPAISYLPDHQWGRFSPVDKGRFEK